MNIEIGDAPIKVDMRVCVMGGDTGDNRHEFTLEISSDGWHLPLQLFSQTVAHELLHIITWPIDDIADFLEAHMTVPAYKSAKLIERRVSEHISYKLAPILNQLAPFR